MIFSQTTTPSAAVPPYYRTTRALQLCQTPSDIVPSDNTKGQPHVGSLQTLPTETSDCAYLPGGKDKRSLRNVLFYILLMRLSFTSATNPLILVYSRYGPKNRLIIDLYAFIARPSCTVMYTCSIFRVLFCTPRHYEQLLHPVSASPNRIYSGQQRYYSSLMN